MTKRRNHGHPLRGRTRRTGPAELTYLLLVVALSFGGALVFPLSDLGRTSPSSVSRQWLGFLLIWWVLLAAWALALAVIHHKFAAGPWCGTLRAAPLAHSPLVLGFGLAAALYASDSFNHLFTSTAYGQLIYQPLAKGYVFVAPAAVQAMRILGRRRLDPRRIPAVALIFLAALALRLWNINWGLPALFHTDEHQYVGRAFLMMATGDPNPHYFENPSLMIYITDVLYLLLGQQAQAFHVVAGMLGVQILDPRGDYLVVTASRAFSALAGALTVVSLYLAGRELLGRRAALHGAALLAVCFLHVRNSHYGTNDVVATALASVSFLFSTRIYSRGRWRHYLLAGLFGGLGTAAKYNLGFFVAPLLVAHVARTIRGRPPAKVENEGLEPRRHGAHGDGPEMLSALRGSVVLIPPLLVGAAGSAAGFVAGTPYSLLDFPTFWSDFHAQYGYGARSWLGQQALPPPALYLMALVQGFGLLPLALALVGLVLAWRRDRWACGLLLSMPVAYLLFMSAQRLFFARFAVPILPYLALLGGYALWRLEGRWQPIPGRQWLAAGLSIVALGQPLAMSVQSDLLLGRADTRTIAAVWIEDKVPEGSSIAVDGYAEEDNEFHWTRYVGRKTWVYWPENDQTSALAASGANDYVVLSSFGYGPWQTANDSSQLPPALRPLETRGRPAASFGPGPDNSEIPYSQDDMYTPFWHLFDRERPGPAVRIYDLRASP